MSQCAVIPVNHKFRGFGVYLNATQALTANTWTLPGSGKWTAHPWYPTSAVGSVSVGFPSTTYWGLKLPSTFGTNVPITMHGVVNIAHNSSVGLGINLYIQGVSKGFSPSGSPNGHQEFLLTGQTASSNNVVSMGIWVTDSSDSATAGSLFDGTFLWIDY